MGIDYIPLRGYIDTQTVMVGGELGCVYHLHGPRSLRGYAGQLRLLGGDGDDD